MLKLKLSQWLNVINNYVLVLRIRGYNCDGDGDGDGERDNNVVIFT